MAFAPEVTLPVRADPAPLIGVIDVIVRHLSALREELLLSQLPAGAISQVRLLHTAVDGFCASCGDPSPCRPIRALNGEVA
jgi:hypothetical protein